MDIKSLENQINNLAERINLLSAAITALQRSPKSLNEEIFQRYIEFESTPKVAKYLRDKGIRTSQNTSFQPSNVSEIIKNNHNDVDTALAMLAHEIFNKNTKAVAGQYW